MKIGYIVQQFYPTSYGSGVHAFELSKELVKLGHEVHVITKGEPTQKSYEIFKGLHIHRILPSFHTPYYFPLNSILLWIYGKTVLQKLNVDVLIGHGFETSLFYKLEKKIPFIYKAVGTIGLQRFRDYLTKREILGKFYFPFLGFSEKTAINHADCIIAISNTIKTELSATYHIPAKRIHRVYNGVNLHRFCPNHNNSELKTQLGLTSKRIILFVGRLSPIKGPQILLKAIPLIIKKIPDSVFLFVGDGPLQSYLHKMTYEFHITDYVRFLGFVSNAEIPKYFTMADLVIIPSLYEPFGLVALESLASETPILSSAQGGLAEIHAYLKDFPTLTPLSPQIIAQQVISLFSNPAELKRLGHKGRKIVAQYFSWERNAQQINKLIEKINENRKKN